MHSLRWRHFDDIPPISGAVACREDAGRLCRPRRRRAAARLTKSARRWRRRIDAAGPAMIALAAIAKQV
jgi:hypothetical protein